MVSIETAHMRSYRASIEAARATVLSIADAAETMRSMAAWISGVSADYSEEKGYPNDYFASQLQLDTLEGPIPWCESRGFKIEESVKTELRRFATMAAVSSPLTPAVAYIVGKAAMEAAIATPRGTHGLTLPYLFVEHLDGQFIAYAGADDRLVEERDQLKSEVLAELNSEAALWRTKPLMRILGPEVDFLKSSVQLWPSAVGMEQAVSMQMNSGMPIPTFGRVLMTIAHAEPAFVATKLEEIGSPTLISAILSDRYGIDIPVLLSLLATAESVVEPARVWNRKILARLVIHEVEEWCSELVRNENYERRATGNVTLSSNEIQIIVADIVKQVISVIRTRTADGFRLFDEWLSHLLSNVIGREQRLPFGQQKTDEISDVASGIINTLVENCASDKWAYPSSIWTVLGGAESAFSNPTGSPGSRVHSDRASRPQWINQRGNEDGISPLLVAVILARSDARRGEDIRDLEMWTEIVLTSLENEPYLGNLGNSQSSTAASLLAWPIGMASSPHDRILEVWKEATQLRIRAKFGWPSRDIKAMETCIAIVAVALMTLSWSKAIGLQKAHLQSLAILIADQIDEIRYSMPAVGLDSWDVLPGRLAAYLAEINLLVEPGFTEELLVRYIGSDEALANFLVNAVRNETLRTHITGVLKSLNLDVRTLTSRWEIWHDRDTATSSPLAIEFYKQLVALG